MISRLTFLCIFCLLLSSNRLFAVQVPPGNNGPLTLADFIVVPATCQPVGSIKFKGNAAGFTFAWEDSEGQPITAERVNSSLSTGIYKLTYTKDGSIPYQLEIEVEQNLPSAGTQNELKIACGESTLRVHGNAFSSNSVLSYRWEDINGKEVDTREWAILSAGQYFLIVTDAQGCSSDKASINIKAASERPTIDISSAKILSSGCAQPDGSITGLTVTTVETGPLVYSWNDLSGKAFGDQLDLLNVPAGKYRLTTRLANGTCESISSEFEVKQRNPLISSTNNVNTKLADCQQPNGAVTGVVTNATSFRWIDAFGETVATTLDMTNVKEGYYELILSNNFGCSETLGPFHVKAGNPPIVMQNQPVIANDSCGLGKGSILGARVIASGIRYSWADATGREISKDPDLRNIKAGNYFLTISNPACSQTYPYTVQNVERILAKPVMEDKFVCSATGISIVFKEVAPLYRIYNENGDIIHESKNKSFLLNVTQNATYYAVLANGECESIRTSFAVSIGEAALQIPSSFSPNNDGTNDYWVIKGLEIYNTADVKVFNRYGASVYHNLGANKAFDGKQGGNDLPAGVYFYVIKLTNECNPFTGSVTIIR